LSFICRRGSELPFAAAAYSASANVLMIAAVESAWFAWVVAAIMPITLQL
jgi:hypothetical protein